MVLFSTNHEAQRYVHKSDFLPTPLNDTATILQYKLSHSLHLQANFYQVIRAGGGGYAWVI